MRYVGLLAVMCLPLPTLAAVSFSEIAWMGTTESATDEWIELHNSGVATTVTDWTVQHEGEVLATLAGTIPASSYVVLERTDDATAPGTAFLIYTGALPNTGGTLELRQADGSLVDRVVGGEDWAQLGGDNDTKETAQYTSSGWQTAPATPGAAPAGVTSKSEPAPATSTDEADETDRTATHSSATVDRQDDGETDGGGGKSIELTLPGQQLELAVVGPKRVSVNQPLELTVKPSGVGSTFAESLRYQWNFGDLHAATGQTVTHTYRYPGTYVVTVRGAYARQEQLARHTVTVLPVTLSLEHDPAGNLLLHNDAPYELDLSDYQLVGASEQVRIPPHTIILPKQTITIPAEQLGSLDAQLVALYDAAGEMTSYHRPAHLPSGRITPVAAADQALARGEAQVLAPAATGAEAPVAAGVTSERPQPESNTGPYRFATDPAPETTAAAEATDSATTSSAAPQPPAARSQVAAAAGAESRTDVPLGAASWPYFALVAVLSVATLGLLASRPRNEHN